MSNSCIDAIRVDVCQSEIPSTQLMLCDIPYINRFRLFSDSIGLEMGKLASLGIQDMFDVYYIYGEVN